MKERICLVEDDPGIQEFVGRKLRSLGYQVVQWDRAEPLMNPASVEAHDLFVVDRLLAGKATGLELCSYLRKHSRSVPILVLSALSESADRVDGLKTGADDYLAKPFEMEELVLRLEGMLKRRSWYQLSTLEMFRWDGRAVDFRSLEIEVGGVKTVLSQREAMLLKLLVEKQGAVVSRDEILDRIWGYRNFPTSRTVDNFILRLRRVVEDDAKSPKYIHSVRGMGYKFTPA